MYKCDEVNNKYIQHSYPTIQYGIEYNIIQYSTLVVHKG